MSYRYRFCPTCCTYRAAFGYHCSVCGGVVRRADHSFKADAPAEPNERWQFSRGWRVITAAEVAQRARQVSTA